MSASVSQRWQWVIESYEDWVKSGHDMVPQLDLVKRLARSKYADEFYPENIA